MRPRSGRRLAALGVALGLGLSPGCAVPERMALPDRAPLPDDATRLTYAGGGSSGYSRPDGRPCPGPGAEVRLGVAGWAASRDEELACLADTLDHGPWDAALELRWRGALPADGSYDLLARDLTLAAWGRVVARSGPLGEYVARARFELVARAPSCTASHVQELARAGVSATGTREASFGGWIVVPDLVLDGCRAGEVLEARLRLRGEVNRGRVEVESYGVVAARAVELQDALAVRRRPDPPPATPTSPIPPPP